MKDTPAPAEVLACFQKLDDDSLSMDIHRNVKALDLVCHESKPLLEPLVVRGGAIPTITKAYRRGRPRGARFWVATPAQSSGGETLCGIQAQPEASRNCASYGRI